MKDIAFKKQNPMKKNYTNTTHLITTSNKFEKFEEIEIENKTTNKQNSK